MCASEVWQIFYFFKINFTFEPVWREKKLESSRETPEKLVISDASQHQYDK